MAVSSAGTPVVLTSGSLSVSIPETTKMAVLTWSNATYSGSGQGLNTATINGVSYTSAVESTNIGAPTYQNAQGIAVWDSPATGTQTVVTSFDGASDEGPTRILSFLTATGSVALRVALQAGAATGSTSTSLSFTGLTAGDFALHHDQKYNAVPSLQSGYTSLQTQTNNSEGARVQALVISGTTATATTQGPDYSSISGGVFYDTGGGGGGLSIPIAYNHYAKMMQGN